MTLSDRIADFDCVECEFVRELPPKITPQERRRVNSLVTCENAQILLMRRNGRTPPLLSVDLTTVGALRDLLDQWAEEIGNEALIVAQGGIGGLRLERVSVDSFGMIAKDGKHSALVVRESERLTLIGQELQAQRDRQATP